MIPRAKNQHTIEYQKNQEARAEELEPFKQLSSGDSKNTTKDENSPLDNTIDWPERKLSPKSRWDVG